MSSYAGGTSRRNTRSSLNAVSSGRAALNTRSQHDRDTPFRPRYVPNVGVSSVHLQEQSMLANSTAAAPPQPPDAAMLAVASSVNDGDRSAARGRPPPPSDRRPVTVTVLSEHRPSSTLPIDHSWHTPRPRSPPFIAATSDEAVAPPCYTCLLYTSPSPRD